MRKILYCIENFDFNSMPNLLYLIEEDDWNTWKDLNHSPQISQSTKEILDKFITNDKFTQSEDFIYVVNNSKFPTVNKLKKYLDTIPELEYSEELYNFVDSSKNYYEEDDCDSDSYIFDDSSINNEEDCDEDDEDEGDWEQ